MGTLAKAFIVGHVGADLDLKKTHSGKSVVSFSLATSDRRGGEDKTTWHNITAWEARADLCDQFLKKGMQVTVIGRLTQEEWQNSDGEKRRKTVIVLDELVLPSGKQASMQSAKRRDETVVDRYHSDDIPF